MNQDEVIAKVFDPKRTRKLPGSRTVDVRWRHHDADYDIGETFARNDLHMLIDRDERAIQGWNAVRDR